MSILFFEGFETCGTELGLANQATTRPRVEDRWDATGSGGIKSSDSFFLINDPFTEGYALQMGSSGFSNGNFLRWNVPEELQQAPGSGFNEWIIGCRFHVPGGVRTFDLIEQHGEFGGSSDTSVLHVQVENSANINVGRASPGAFEIANADGVLTPNQWYYLEFRFKIAESGAGGLIEVRLDGNIIIAETIADTNNALSTGFTYFRLENSTANDTGNDYVAYDDIYVMYGGESPHTDFLGPVRVRSLPPNTDIEPGWNTEPDSGDNYTKVDENGADDSDYVWTDTNNTRDRYGFTDPTEDNAIIAVKMEVEATNPVGGNPSIFLEISSDGNTESVEFAVTNTTDYDLFSMIVEQDPAGGDWTVEAVEDVRGGYLFQNNVG